VAPSELGGRDFQPPPQGSGLFFDVDVDELSAFLNVTLAWWSGGAFTDLPSSSSSMVRICKRGWLPHGPSPRL
jgi:hypothetical protein